MKAELRQRLRELPRLLEVPVVDLRQRMLRIETMERNIMLPLKAAALGLVFYSLILTPWLGVMDDVYLLAVEYTQSFFWIYAIISFAAALVLLYMRSLPPALVEWTVFGNCLLDALFLAALTVVTGGYDSILYWLFVCLMMRNAVSLPPAAGQLILNLLVSICYALASLADAWIIENLDDTTQRALDPAAGAGIGEPLVARLALLWVTAACGFALQVLLERQRLASEEAREFEAREGQLRSAGRVAAEFAHQLKNPLAIINNCAYSLRRNLTPDAPASIKQLDIIQEEISRADQIITQVMGYAKLSEGHVEKLDVREELDRAVAEVFPEGTVHGIELRREYAGRFPPLLMQRRHFREIVVNLLKNSAEALQGAGTIHLVARCHQDYTTEITLRDDGPGIEPGQLERVFEAYYTTKSRGTGLGLSIVKHNVELYGGKVSAQSELGKGAVFTVLFPGKSFNRIGQ